MYNRVESICHIRCFKFVVERILYETEEAGSIGHYPSPFLLRVSLYIRHEWAEPRQCRHIVEDRENLRGPQVLIGANIAKKRATPFLQELSLSFGTLS